MEVKVKDFKRLVLEGLKELKEARSVSNVKLIVNKDGTVKMINPEDGRVLANDVSNWEYKKYQSVFKSLGTDFIRVEGEGVSKRVDPYIRSGHYSKRKFLDKIGDRGFRQGKTYPIIKGEPVQQRRVNTLSTQRHIPHRIPAESFEYRVLKRILSNKIKKSK